MRGWKFKFSLKGVKIKSFLIFGVVSSILYSQNLNWSQPIPVTSDSSPVRGLSLIQNAQNIPWVVYSQNGDLFYTSLIIDDSFSWNPPTQLTNSPEIDANPDVTTDSNGRIWVVWASYSESEDDWDIFLTYEDTSGFIEPKNITSDTLDSHSPKILAGNDGDVWIAWKTNKRQLGYTTLADLYVARFQNGQLVETINLTQNENVSTVGFIGMAMDSSGKLWIAWNEGAGSMNWPGSFYRVYVSYFDGEVWHPATAVSPPCRNWLCNQLLTRENGELWLFTYYIQIPDASYIQYQVLLNDSTWSEPQSPSLMTNWNADYDAFAYSARGYVWLIWNAIVENTYPWTRALVCRYYNNTEWSDTTLIPGSLGRSTYNSKIINFDNFLCVVWSFSTLDSGWVYSNYVNISTLIIERRGYNIRENNFKIFPTISNSFFKLNYILDRPMTVSIKVFDLLGRATGVLEKGVKQPGTYCKIWKSEELPSGIYFIEFKTPFNKQVKKIIKLRRDIK